MAKKGKKYLEAAKAVDATKQYTPEEAVNLLKKIDFAKFDETVEVAYRLNVDPKQADQQIRGAVVLPNGTGKTSKVIVFAQGDQAKAAEDAGADIVGAEDLVQKIQDGWLDFDVAVATPPMMAQVGRLGRILGPKGLMPNPKTGTVTMDTAKAVNDIKAGQVDADKLLENFKAMNDIVLKARPASTKGIYIKSLTLTSTMAPGIKVNPTDF